MISINATLFIQIILFLVLAFILKRLLIHPTLKIINERVKYIQDTNKKLLNIEEETEELVQKCISMETTARQTAHEKSAILQKEAREIAEKLFQDSRDQIASIKEKVGREVEEKIEVARQSLQSEAVQVADVLTEKLIGRRIGN